MSGQSKRPIEEELINRLGWFVALRWLAGIGVIGAVLFSKFILKLEMQYVVLIITAVIILFYNLIFYLILYKLKNIPEIVQANIQILIDWVALTLLIYFSGGIENPFIFYFIFHMIIASLLLSKKSAYIQATCAVFLASSMVMAGYFRVIPHFGIRGFLQTPLFASADYVFSFLFVFISTSYISVYLASTISSKLRVREAELKQTFEKINALYEVAKATSATLDLTEVLNLVVKNAAHLMKAKASSIRLLDPKGKQLNISAAYGLSDSYLKKGAVDVEKSLVDKEALSGSIVIISDATVDPRFQYPEQARKEGIRSVLCVPLIVKDSAIGVIRIYTSEIYKFSDKEIDFLSALASQSAIAIENAKTYNELEGIHRSRTEFFMTTAHELKTPLAAIQSCLKVVLEGYGAQIDDKSRNMIRRAENRANNAIRLVKDLLDLVGMGGKVEKCSGKKMSVESLVKRTFDAMSVQSQEKDVKLVYHPSKEHLDISIDENDMDLVLSNLLSNAINYSYNGGEVVVEAVARGDDVLFTVTDFGIGVADEDKAKIFTEFYRAKNAKEKVEVGTGLGLSIVTRIIKCYNGSIWLESKLGKGSKFSFTLPRVRIEE